MCITAKYPLYKREIYKTPHMCRFFGRFQNNRVWKSESAVSPTLCLLKNKCSKRLRYKRTYSWLALQYPHMWVWLKTAVSPSQPTFPLKDPLFHNFLTVIHSYQPF